MSLQKGTGEQQMNEAVEKIIEKAAEKAANKTVERLRKCGHLKDVYCTSFQKTEKVLYLYTKLPADHPERQRIDKALETIKDSDYCDVIASKYFDGLTISEISDIYDCKYQNITYQKNQLIKRLAVELFPEDVLAEIINR